jgi:hypothetical protein
MAEQQLVKSIYTDSDVTSLGEFAATDTFPLANAPSGLARQTGDDSVLTRQMLKDCGAVYLDKGASGTTTQDLAYTGGSHQRIQATGAFTITTSAWPPSGNLGELLLELAADGTPRAITWPTINWVKSDGTTTTTFSSNGVTLQTANNAIDWVFLWTRDAGTTIYGKVMR